MRRTADNESGRSRAFRQETKETASIMDDPFQRLEAAEEAKRYHQRLLWKDGWTIESELASGAFGRVYLVSKETTDESGNSNVQRCAAKLELNRDKPRRLIVNSLKEEGQYVQALSKCPQIVGFVKHDENFLLMEHCEMTLAQYIQKASAAEIETDEVQWSCLFADILLAIAYCHEMGICHRDMKPDNIAIQSKSPTTIIGGGNGSRPWYMCVLIDFGTALNVSGWRERTTVRNYNTGTPAYMARTSYLFTIVHVIC